MIYIANAFALGMLPDGHSISVRTMSLDDVRREIEGMEPYSIVGHQDTAAVFAGQLQRPVQLNRETVILQHGDILYVGQLAGGRLPEGTTTLPVGFQIIWRRVDVFLAPIQDGREP